jgi:hypothetical protein
VGDGKQTDRGWQEEWFWSWKSCRQILCQKRGEKGWNNSPVFPHALLFHKESITKPEESEKVGIGHQRGFCTIEFSGVVSGRH